MWDGRGRQAPTGPDALGSYSSLVEQNIKAAKMAAFNARAETIETKPFFRDAFKRTRCLIPMSGYYEWSPPLNAM
jgi:putative SOS response-associated peptidase YedK